MRRFVSIASLVIAVGLLIGGGWFLVKASRVSGWGAAAPAVAGIGCWIVAAVFAGRHVARVVAFPLTALLGHLFYPQDRFTAPPKSLLRTLRARIAEGRFKSVERQVDALLEAYPKDSGLYHVRALLEGAKGRDVRAVTAAASRALSSEAFAEYKTLLRTMPVQRPNKNRW